MTFVRRTVATIVTLTIGISAAWLHTADRDSSHPPVASPLSAERSIAESRVDQRPVDSPVTAAGEDARPVDCCGGNAVAPNEADLEALTQMRQKRPAIMAKFDTWAEAYARSTSEERKDLLADGITLARERHPMMADLIRTNPREAIEAADHLSPLARKEMPVEVVEHLERMVSGRGDLEVYGVIGSPGTSYERLAHIGSETFATYVYGKREEPIPETNTPLLGVSLAARESSQVNGKNVEWTKNLLALREDRFRVLSKAEVALVRQTEPQPTVHHCPVSGDETTANADESAIDVGGEVAWLCKSDHVTAYTDRKAIVSGSPVEARLGGPGEGAGSFAVVPAGWATGNKRMIALRIRFSDQPENPYPLSTAEFDNMYRTLCDQYRQWSYGRGNFVYDLTPVLTLPLTEAAYYQNRGGRSGMMDDAIALADAAGYQATNADFQQLLIPSSWQFEGGACGWGSIVGRRSWVRCFGLDIMMHELGHCLGLPHANSWSPTTFNPLGPGIHGEYGGAYNTMNNWSLGSFDTMMRFYIRWLTYNEAHDVTSNGTYRIYDPEVTNLTADRRYTIRISKQGGQFYFIEFRPRATALANGAAVNATTQNGIRILRTNGSEQLDVTPLSTAGTADAAVVVGQVFTDPEAGITITPIARGGNGTDQYMDVSVTYMAPALYSGGVYELQPQCAPGACLDVSGGLNADGANVQIWAGNGSAAQQWKLEDQGGGQWELIPQNAPTRRLDVNGGGSANFTNVQIWQDSVSPSPAQRWSLTNVGGGYFELTPQCAPGARLDVNGAGSSNGTNVQIYQATANNAAQRWRLLATGPQNGAIYTLEPQCAPGKRLDVNNGLNADGTNVQIWTAINNNPNQQWKLEDSGAANTSGRLFEVIPQCATTRRLDVTNAGTANGTNIQIYQDVNQDRQRWWMVDVGNGYYEFIPQHALGSRADVNGAQNVDGANVHLWGSNSGSAQRWRLYRQ